MFACLHEVISSFRLFREANSGLQIIKYFSQRHRLHRFEAGLYGAPCFKIFQVTLKFKLLSFKCQICLLSSVLNLLFELQNDVLWFAYLVRLERILGRAHVGLERVVIFCSDGGLVDNRFLEAITIHRTVS